MSIDLVARRAAVTRPAVYRRWPTLAHLVHQAVFGAERRVVVAESGDFAADLRALAAAVGGAYARPEVRAALAGMLSDLHDHPELRASVIDDLEQQVREQFAALLARAVARGEVRPFDVDVLLDALIGSVFRRATFHDDAPPEFLDDLVDLLLRGVAR